MNDKTPQELLELAMVYHRSGRLADAEPLYRQVLATHPNTPGALHLLGLLAFQSGRPEIALELINRAISLNPVSADYHLNRGVVLDNTGRPQEAVTAFRQSISLRPNIAEAHANLGNALRKVGKCAEAVAECKRALELKPDYVEAYTNLGNALLDMGAVDEAMGALGQVARLRPDFAEGHYNFGNALARRGRFDEAIAEYETALKLKPDFLHVMASMGQVLTEKGRVDEGIAACRKSLEKRSDFLAGLMNLSQALRRKSELDHNPALMVEAIGYLRQAAAAHGKVPEVHLTLGLALAAMRDWTGSAAAHRQALALRSGFAEALCGLGNALGGMRDWDAAADAFRQAVVARPEYAEAFYGLGLTFCNMGRLEEAVPAFRRALALKPDFAPTYAILGAALSDLGEVDEAISVLRQAAALLPAVSSIQNNLGVALRKIAQHEAANACFERAIALDPAGVIADSNRVYALYFHPAYDSEAILREHRIWNQRHAEPLRPQIKVLEIDRAPERRLRVGYVSPDFREHCQSLFTAPLLANHDHGQFEIFCYADVINPDPVTDRLRAMSDQWRLTSGMDDQAVAEMVRNDRIDILVDLTMHMLNGRPLVFARKPAPVQVAWLAYPGTTGMTAIDARFTDPYLDPPGEHDGWYSERSLPLGETFWCYDPMGMATDDAPLAEPGELPAKRNGYVTFGCLNSFFKINEGTLKIWSGVLNATPGSKLRMLAPQGESRRWVIGLLTQLGIAAERVDFVPYQSRRRYMAEYQNIDIGLDTVPYNGHTTSLDAMWMGVPVVTRVGRTVVGRAGWSQLSNLQLTELAAWDDDSYVRVAVELAGDLGRIEGLRASMRQRLSGSALMDGVKFARSIESAYRQLWNEHCQLNPPS